MADLLQFLAVLVGIATVIALAFWLGYDTARKKRERHYQIIRESYLEVIRSTRELTLSAPGKAHAKGYREGYQRGLSDSYAALQQLMEAEFEPSLP